MSTWFNDAWAYVLSLLQSIDARSVLSFLGQKLFEGLFQAVAVVVIGWLVLYRQWRQLTQGKSDQVIFSANLFTPLGKAKSALGRMESGMCSSSEPCCHPRRSTSFWTTWRSAGSCVTWPNRPPWWIRSSPPREPPASRSSTTSSIASREAWHPHRSGAISGSWRSPARIGEVVRKCCIRVLLVRRSDLERLASWEWCRGHVLVEAWYHYWRIVTLHQIALRFQEEQARQEQGRAKDIQQNLLPLVDRQAHHPRIRTLSLGINVDEPIIKPPLQVDWERYLPQDRGAGAEAPGGL